MKKLVILLFAAILFASCNFSKVEKQPSPKEASMFVIVEKTDSWEIVYHYETKVMYAVSDAMYNRGIFTLLVDREGKPLIYKGN